MKDICLTYHDNNIDMKLINETVINTIKKNISKNIYKYKDNDDNIKNLSLKNLKLSQLRINNDKILIPVIIFNKSGQNIDITFANNFIDSLNNYYAGNDSDYNLDTFNNIDFGSKTSLKDQFNSLVSLKNNINIFFYLKEIRTYNKITLSYSSFPTTIDNDIKKTNGEYDIKSNELNKYLPIWIIDDIQYTSGGNTYRIYGRAQFSYFWYYYRNDTSYQYTDGVILRYNTIASNEDRGKNKTAVHEIGHWLGLYHTFEQNPYSSVTGVDLNENGIISDDEKNGDCIEDTPPQVNATYENPFSDGIDTFPGNDNTIPVSDINKLVIFFNYMDYTNDNCMCMFTNDQCKKMYYMTDTYRYYLKRGNMIKNINISLSITNNYLENNIYYVKNNSIISLNPLYINNIEKQIFITWKKNDTIISPSSQYSINNNALQINIINNIISGAYKFVITNNYETYTSNIINLQYLQNGKTIDNLKLLPITHKLINNIYYINNSTKQLKINFNNYITSIPISYKWYYNNKLISNNTIYNITNNILNLKKINSTLNGSYYVIIKNKYDQIKSNVINIKYKDIPIISNVSLSLQKISGNVINTDKSTITIKVSINNKTYSIIIKNTTFTINITSAKLKKNIQYNYVITSNNTIFNHTYNSSYKPKLINKKYSLYLSYKLIK